MALSSAQKAHAPAPAPRQSDNQVEGAAETQAGISGLAIELSDLSTGVDAEVNRLKSRMTLLLGEIGQIRGEHAGMAADYQKLTGELRDIKLVLAKVHAKELRGVERRASWMESFRRLREMFQKQPHPLKNPQAKIRSRSLLK